MPAKKGTLPPNAGKGRKPGTPNKATTDVRAAIALFAQNNVHLVEGWLRRGAKKDPLRAMEAYARIIEYYIPKLSRAEVTGGNGKPLEVKLVSFLDVKPDDLPS